MSQDLSLEELRDRVSEALDEHEKQYLERELSYLEGENRLVDLSEAFGELIDPRERYHDTPDFNFADFRISTPDQRAHGDNSPLWRSEHELAQIRGVARWLCNYDEYAIGILGNLTNYTIGTGFQYKVTPKEGTSEAVALAAQKVLDRFVLENKWEGNLERELFERWIRDGEFFLKLRRRGRSVKAQVVEPEYVYRPADPREIEDHFGLDFLDWSYGIASSIDDHSEVWGYNVFWYGENQNWEFCKPSQMHHALRNVDRGIKRGLSDYFAAASDMERGEKLMNATAHGAAIQACIAMILESAPGVTSTGISAYASSVTDRTTRVTRPDGGTRSIKQEKFSPGQKYIVPNGQKYHPGPMGSSDAQTYIDVLQAIIRRVGLRWHMPEYMISGDASNANYSSTLVAESPFVKSTEARQSFIKAEFERIMWKVLRMSHDSGELRGLDLPSLSMEEHLEIEVTSPDVAVRDKLQDHQIRKEQNEAGLLSLETWAEEEGRDFEQEQNRGASRLSDPAPDPFGRDPFSLDQFRSPGLDQDGILNGAQITAAKDVLQELSAGRTARVVAVELLITLGIDPQKAEKMATEAERISAEVFAKDAPGQEVGQEAKAADKLESVHTTEQAKKLIEELYP